MKSADKAAREILENLASIYQPTHQYITVEENQFPHLDLNYYRQTQALLEQSGFRLVADIEDQTLRESKGNVLRPVMIRSLLSADGSIMAGVYHPRPKFWIGTLLFFTGQKMNKVLDCETALSDGTFIVTSNAAMADALTPPPQIFTTYLKPTTSPSRVLSIHQQTLALFREKSPTVNPIPQKNLADILASQNRMNALCAAYRGEIGGVTKEELRKLSSGNQDIADRVHQSIEEMRS